MKQNSTKRIPCCSFVNYKVKNTFTGISNEQNPYKCQWLAPFMNEIKLWKHLLESVP